MSHSKTSANAAYPTPILSAVLPADISADPAFLPPHARDIPPQQMPVNLHINGQSHKLSLDTRTTLLDALREHLNLGGTKKGCDHG